MTTGWTFTASNQRLLHHAPKPYIRPFFGVRVCVSFAADKPGAAVSTPKV